MFQLTVLKIYGIQSLMIIMTIRDAAWLKRHDDDITSTCFSDTFLTGSLPANNKVIRKEIVLQ